jgi:ribose transport system ATP-binding protein
VQGSVSTAKVTVGELVEMIVGRAVDIQQIERRTVATTAPAVVVDGLRIDGVSYPAIEAHDGEVVGLTGLPGTGFDRVPYAVFGADRPERGTLTLDGQPHDLRRHTPLKAVHLGIGLLPADRQRQGAVGSLPVEDNVMSPVLSRFRTPVGLNRRAITSASRDLMERFDVRPRDPAKTFQALSGGNQQKALVGKWLQLGMRVWLLHEPTQGVDVGARQQIFRDVRAAAAEGMTVLCASNDHEQLALLCDRVLVFGSRGRIRELTGSEISKRMIGAVCFDLVDSLETASQNGDGDR